MLRHFLRFATASFVCLVVFPAAAQSQSCPARRLPNGRLAPPNWCAPRKKPQVLPRPSPNPNTVWVPSPGGGGTYVSVSAACYVSFQPPSGCYLNQSAPIGSACYCIDPNSGYAYNGQLD
jgi:hypothetical protein